MLWRDLILKQSKRTVDGLIPLIVLFLKVIFVVLGIDFFSRSSSDGLIGTKTFVYDAVSTDDDVVLDGDVAISSGSWSDPYMVS